MRSFLDGAVVIYDTRTSNADKRCKPDRFGFSVGRQILQPSHDALARCLLIGVSPQIGLPDTRLLEVGRLLLPQLDDAAANVRPANVDCKNGVVGF